MSSPALYFAATDVEGIVLVVFGIVLGLFTIGGGIFEWEFFFNNSRAKRLVGYIGHTGARIFYVVFGLLLLGYPIQQAWQKFFP